MQPYCLQILWVQVGEISALSAFYFLLNISKIYSVQRVAPAVVYSVHFFSLLRFFYGRWTAAFGHGKNNRYFKNEIFFTRLLNWH